MGSPDAYPIPTHWRAILWASERGSGRGEWLSYKAAYPTPGMRVYGRWAPPKWRDALKSVR